MSVRGKYKCQSNDRYEEYLASLHMSWMQRKKLLYSNPVVLIQELDNGGTLVIQEGSKQQKKIVMGEEYLEILPNGERAKAVTVREGESCFITRLKAPWNLEIRHEFTPQGMTQHIRHLDSDLEANRHFKRC